MRNLLPVKFLNTFPVWIIFVLLSSPLWATTPAQSMAENVGVSSQDRLGRFAFEEFVISPRILMREPVQGGVELQDSFISFRWTKGENLSGFLRLGSEDLAQRPVWYSPITRSSINLLQAYAEQRTEIGRFRIGMMHVPQTYERMYGTHTLQTYATRQNWFFNNDMALQYFAKTAEWATSLTFHNGEMNNNQDQKIWYTGNIAYRDSHGTGASLVFTTGATAATSTSTSTAASKYNFVFDPNDTAKIRYGILSFFSDSARWFYLLEGSRGDIIQADDKHPFGWWHFTVTHKPSKDFSVSLRYEELTPDQKQGQTTVKAPGIGLRFSSKDDLSSVTLFYSKLIETPELINDETQLIVTLKSF